MKNAWAIENGDVVEVLRGFADNYFDALMCDPPYGLKFMHKAWDYDVPSVALWAECRRVLKPGAPLVAFGGARTYHRIACAIEDAGFELRDSLMWLYAKGFPKSMNVSVAIDKAAGATRLVVGTRTLTGNAAISTKEKGGTYGVQVGSIPPKEVPVTAPATELAQLWDGYGTALKPGYEPIVLARKPIEGTVAANVAKWGVGGLAIDACRIGTEQMACSSSRGQPKIGENVSMSVGNYARHLIGEAEGRWPANLLFDEEAAEILDAEVGPRVSGKAVRRNGGGGQIMSGIGDNPYKPKPSLPDLGYMDGKTNPSRFFFCSKVSTKEREAGCEHIEKLMLECITWENEDLKVQLQVDTAASPPRVIVVSGMPSSSASEWSTWLFGSDTSDLPRPAFRFTTRTGTSSITESKTWRLSPRLRTSESTPAASSETGCGGSHAQCAESSDLLTENTGTSSPTARRTLGASPTTLRELLERSASVAVSLGVASNHPTMKPVSLTAWLARLIMPPTAAPVLLVPFSGAGSEMIGALHAGWAGVFGIEREAEYVTIARARLAHWCAVASDTTESANAQASLFQHTGHTDG